MQNQLRTMWSCVFSRRRRDGGPPNHVIMNLWRPWRRASIWADEADRARSHDRGRGGRTSVEEYDLSAFRMKNRKDALIRPGSEPTPDTSPLIG